MKLCSLFALFAPSVLLGFELGTWNTENSLSLISEAEQTGRPIIAVITKETGCANCKYLWNNYLSDSRFLDLSVSYSCYLWRIDVSKVDSSRLFIDRYFPGVTSLPGLSLLDSKQDVDTQYQYASLATETVDDLLSNIEYRLKKMRQSQNVSVFSSTNTTFTLDHSLITIDRPTSVTEGKDIRLTFTRSGSVDDNLVLHVITNGFFCADVSWKSGEDGSRSIVVPTSITPEYDDNRSMDFLVKTLNRRVATDEIRDYSYLTSIISSRKNREYGPVVTQETVRAWLEARTEDAIPCQWNKSPVLTLKRAKETGFPALFFLTGQQGKGCLNKRSEVDGFNINLNLQSTCDVINDYNTIYLCYSNNEDDWKSIKTELHIDDWTEDLWNDGYSNFEGTHWKMYMPFILLVQADGSGVNTIFAIQRSKYEPKYSPYASEMPLTELSEKTKSSLENGTYCCKSCLFGRSDSTINRVTTTGQFAPFLDEYLKRYTNKHSVDVTDVTTNATQFILHRNNVIQRFTVNLTDGLWIGYPTYLMSYPIDCIRVVAGQWWVDQDHNLRAWNPVSYVSGLCATCSPTNNGMFVLEWKDNVPITIEKLAITNVVDSLEYDYFDTGLDECVGIITNTVFLDANIVSVTNVVEGSLSVNLSSNDLIRITPSGPTCFTTFDFIPDRNHTE